MKKIGIIVFVFLSFTFSLDFYQNADFSLKWGISSDKNDIDPIFNWDDLTYTLSTRMSEDLYTKLKLNFGNTGTIFSHSNLVENAFIHNNGIILGKFDLPYGRFKSHLISDTFTREILDLKKTGIMYTLVANEQLQIKGALFNNYVNDAMTGFAGTAVFTPRENVIFYGSGYLDKEGTISAKNTRLEINFASMIRLDNTIIDFEVFRGIAGTYKNALVINGSLSFLLSKESTLGFRADWANNTAESIINKHIQIAVGLNHKLDKYANVAFEIGTLSKPSGSTRKASVYFLTKLFFRF